MGMLNKMFGFLGMGVARLMDLVMCKVGGVLGEWLAVAVMAIAIGLGVWAVVSLPYFWMSVVLSLYFMFDIFALFIGIALMTMLRK